MGYSFNQQAIAGGSSRNSQSTAYNTNNTAGNLLVCQVRSAGGVTPNTPTDTVGNIWVLVGDSGVSGGIRTRVYFVASAIAGANTVTFTTTGAADWIFLWIAEYNSGNIVSILDAVSIAAGKGSVSLTFTSTPLTPVDAGELLLLNLQPLGNRIVTDAGTGFTVRHDDSDTTTTAVLDNVNGASGLQTALATLNINDSCNIVFSAFRLSGPITNRILVADGDSITAGAGITTPYTSLLSLNQTTTVYNIGVSGESLATMITNAGTDVDSRFQLSPQGIVVIWGGTNDFALNGTSVAGVYAELVAYCLARRAVGWKVVVVTMMSRGGNDTRGIPLDIDKNAYNALIRENWRSFADALADIALDPTLGADGAYSNTTYFLTDGALVHPTQIAVTNSIAPLISAAINSLI